MTATNILKIIPKIISESSFSFNKKGVPSELLHLLEEIENNKRKWKALYMAVWGLNLYYLKPHLIDKGEGDKIISWSLPASKTKEVIYTPNELAKYLTTYDRDIGINQLVKLFRLIENYFIEYYKLNKPKVSIKKEILQKVLSGKILKCMICLFPKSQHRIDSIKNKFNIRNEDFSQFQTLKKYLKREHLISKGELLELELAKETRNCFTHRNGEVDQKWLTIYNKSKRKKQFNLHDKIPLEFHDLEDWTDLIIQIVEKSIERYNKN
jgi:hypothetical protein